MNDKIIEKVIKLETIIPEIRKDIKSLSLRQGEIEKNINAISISIGKIKMKLDNQYNWIDKWKMMISAVGVAGGLISGFLAVAYYFSR